MRRTLDAAAARRYFAERLERVVIPKARPPRDRETLHHFWHPQRFGIRLAPPRFRADLHVIHPDLEATWSPFHERWIIWARSDLVRHPLCAGWSLKFVWHGEDGGYLPLDERVFANIFARDFRRYNGAKGYFDRLESEYWRDKEREAASTDEDSRTLRREYNDFRKIKNIGLGNKFSLHHDGSVVPTRGELDWRRELARTRGLR